MNEDAIVRDVMQTKVVTISADERLSTVYLPRIYTPPDRPQPDGSAREFTVSQ